MSTPTRNKPTQSRVQRTGDAFVRFLLRSPLHRMVSSKLLLITVVGRKTGREYTNPVAYAEHEGHLLIGTAAKWRRNLQQGQPVRVRLRGKDIRAEVEVITDEERAAELYPVILTDNPVHGRFAGIGLEPDGTVNRAGLHRAFVNGTAVVRLRPL
jgi:deazaflavin-dependent oxidoreductase (nitroreductase family)